MLTLRVHSALATYPIFCWAYFTADSCPGPIPSLHVTHRPDRWALIAPKTSGIPAVACVVSLRERSNRIIIETTWSYILMTKHLHHAMALLSLMAFAMAVVIYTLRSDVYARP